MIFINAPSSAVFSDWTAWDITVPDVQISVGQNIFVDLGRNPVLAWVAGGDGGGHAEVQLPEQSGQQVVFSPSRSI